MYLQTSEPNTELYAHIYSYYNTNNNNKIIIIIYIYTYIMNVGVVCNWSCGWDRS